MSPTCTMVLLKLHCDVTEATLSAFEARVRGGRGGGSPIRLTDPPAGTTTFGCGQERVCARSGRYSDSMRLSATTEIVIKCQGQGEKIMKRPRCRDDAALVPLLPLASCLSSSEVEVQDEEPHFLFTVLGMLQLSRYLRGGRVG